MRTALYVRVSTRDKQDVSNQLIELRDSCDGEKDSIVKEYVDHESGSRSDRGQFQQMLRDAADKKFDLLIFWSLDRLTREGTLATLKYFEHFEKYGIRWISLKEPWINSAGPLRDVVISLVASLAKQEQVRISERVKAGLQRAKRGGTRTGNPIGRPRAVFDRAKARALRDQGLSWHQIAKQLNVSASTVWRACTTQEDKLPLPKSEPEVLEGMSQALPNRDSARLLPEGP
ncbi:MAG: recombinase family protein [Acidobacteriia bacterium]|nr:recombinase family protein [Terriglobia bacterium]